jgi:hypothetical protein
MVKVVFSNEYGEGGIQQPVRAILFIIGDLDFCAAIGKRDDSIGQVFIDVLLRGIEQGTAGAHMDLDVFILRRQKCTQHDLRILSGNINIHIGLTTRNDRHCRKCRQEDT